MGLLIQQLSGFGPFRIGEEFDIVFRVNETLDSNEFSDSPTSLIFFSTLFILVVIVFWLFLTKSSTLSFSLRLNSWRLPFISGLRFMRPMQIYLHCMNLFTSDLVVLPPNILHGIQILAIPMRIIFSGHKSVGYKHTIMYLLLL